MSLLGTKTFNSLIEGDKSLPTVDVNVGSGTLLKGAVLGRVRTVTPTSGTAGGSNTGNGTCTAVTGGPKTKKGTYTITCDVAITNGGTFRVTDPDGKYLGSAVILAGAGGVIAFKSDQINFTLTDGSTDFVLADVFTVAVTDGTPISAAVSGTGNGTLTLVESRMETKIGAYVLTCTAAATHGGVFSLTNPNSDVIATGITISGGAGGTATFDTEELAGTITDGSTDFIVGDTFTVTTTLAARSVLLLDKTATDGSSVPYAILAEAADASAAVVEAIAYKQGQFNVRELSFASGTDPEDVQEEAAAVGIIFENSIAR